jgi:hypothetical protein
MTRDFTMKIIYSLTSDTNPESEIIGAETRVATDLAPGSYTLSTKVENSDGWSENFNQNIVVPTTADTDRWMFFATGNRVSGGTSSLPVAATGLNYVASKLFFGSAPYKTREFRFHWSGFGINEGGTAPQELLAPGNNVVIDKAWLIIGDERYPIDFSGSASTTIASGSNGVWGHCLPGVDLPANTVFGVITEYHAAVGEKLLYGYRHQRERGEKIWASSTLTSLEALVDSNAPSTAAIDNPSNYNSVTNQFQCFGPDMMLARGDYDDRPVALVTADSHGEARNETAMSADARRNMGFLRRWLDDVGGVGRIPHFIIGMPGAAAQRELTTNALKRWAVLDEAIAFNTDGKRPFTVVLNQMGWNDNNTTAATWSSRIDGLVGRIKARYSGVKVVGMTLFGRATSSAVFSTTASQTLTSPFTAAILGTVNNGIRTNASGALNGYIDAFEAWSDPTDSYKWRPYLDAPQRGTFVETTGDGATAWDTFKTNVPLSVGYDYRFGTISSGSILSSVANGDGTWTNVRSAAYTASVPSGTPLYYAVTGDSIHASPGRTTEIAELIPQSEKSKLV